MSSILMAAVLSGVNYSPGQWVYWDGGCGSYAPVYYTLAQERPRRKKVRHHHHGHRHGDLAKVTDRPGCRFVTLSTHYWDTHQDNFRTLKNTNLPELDRYWSALLDDLADRGLLDTTLVVWAGEFGRTPRINGAAGRDHWACTNAIGLSVAGTRMGTIVGQTDRLCERPTGTGHSTHDFAATLYHILGVDYHQEYRTQDGRPLLVNYHGRPIAEALA